MADDPCEAAFGSVDPTGARKYYRARYYDPSAGRFLSEDPIRWAGGNNFYAYVDNRPVLAGDPSGLSAYLHCEAIPSTRGGGLVGGAVLAVSQARHCYIEVVCPGKYHVTIELYGPSPGAPNGTPMMNLPNPSRNANATTSPIYPHCGNDPKKSQCTNQDCRFEDELINQFNNNQPPPTYNPQGPNSNTFVAGIIRGAGGIANFPYTAYGCDY
jgi:RHS repeat-associated protein